MNFKRTIYLGYYLKQLDRGKLNRFLDFASRESGRSKPGIMSDVLKSVYRHNISILEYFQFRFYSLNEEERSRWAGTGYMYEYQLRMNPLNKRDILDDKTLFYKHYGDFFVHNVADRKDLKNPDIAKEILSNPSGKIVFKKSDGKCGAQVEIRKVSEFDPKEITGFMNRNDYDLVEEFIEQHPHINLLSPSAVNTVRIFTQLDENDEVEILGCRLRISVNSPVDNMAAGNLAAPIDDETGAVNGPAVYSDITKSACSVHPVSDVKIEGFQVPFWDDILHMVKRAAQLHPQNRSIGWDVVVTERGPGLIEGNHDWCKRLWQLPAQKGLKHMLKRYDGSESTGKKKQMKEPVTVS